MFVLQAYCHTTTSSIIALRLTIMATPTEDRASQLIFIPNVIENSSITNTKFFSACFAGAAAGILGMENWTGFVLFFVSTLFTSALIYGVSCRGRPRKYFQGGLMELMNPGQDTAFTFVLVWTLFYGKKVLRSIDLELLIANDRV